jgi:hypothetical protein
MITVAIHQPNFMPWYPFFQKMARSNIFVILTTAQYVKGNYHNRFNIDRRWFTMSANKHPAFQRLDEKVYLNPKEDWTDIKHRLPEYEKLLSLFDELIDSNLTETNYRIIARIAALLEIPTVIVPDRYLNGDMNGPRNLLRICLALNADRYLGGPSTDKYFTDRDRHMFQEAGVMIKVLEKEKQVQRPILEILNEKLKKGF